MNNVKPDPVRLCENCHKPLVRQRRPDGTLERPSTYIVRKSCSPACRAALQATEISIKLPCEGCGAELVRKQYKSGRMESYQIFNKRVTCNRGCGALARAKNAEKKDCEQCGKALTPKQLPEGRYESSITFGLRKFCDKSCYSESLKTKSKEIKLPEPFASTTALASPRKHAPVVLSAPKGSTHKNEFGVFKRVGERVFRYNGHEWRLSNFKATHLYPKHRINRGSAS